MRAEILTLRDVWLAGYRRLVAEALTEGRIQMRPPGEERRTEPRFRLLGGNVLAPELGPVLTVDVSAVGAALISPVPMPVDGHLTLSLANAFSTDLTVVACDTAPESTAAFPSYLVRSRFVDHANGLQFVTLALELERIERD